MAWVWTVLFFTAFGALAWWAYRSDPHWVAKDGRAFTCRLQRIGEHALPEGRWKEARAFVEGSRIIVRPRGLLTSGKFSGHYAVLRRVDEQPKNRVVWLVDGGGLLGHEFAVLRIPASSRAVPVIDSLIGRADGAADDGPTT